MDAIRAVEYLAFDLETTGLFAEADRVVEIGAVRFDAEGRERGRFEQLVDPGRPISPSARAVHGIDDADLIGAPRSEAILPEFVAFLGDPESTVLLAHNACFDAGFLGRELARAGLPMPAHSVIDTLPMARRRWPSAPDHRLETLAALLGLETDGAHRALADSRRLKGLWLALAAEPEKAGPRVAYPIFDPDRPHPAPRGWERLVEAAERGDRVRMAYAGGTRGTSPREITPIRFAHRGGVAFVIALCHLDQFEKAFRLDRVRQFEVVPKPETNGETPGSSRLAGGPEGIIRRASPIVRASCPTRQPILPSPQGTGRPPPATLG